MLRIFLVITIGGLFAFWSGKAGSQGLPTPPQTGLNAAGEISPAEDPNVDVLLRGPVHEAFAEPVTIDAGAAAPVVREKPPETVDELPPDARPEDASAVWIPGYWNWDDVEKRYIWVSGVWRIPPSGQRWVPGYWNEADGGYQRVSGFWSPVAEQEVQYLAAPPESLEVGPNVAAPSENHFWIPGCWIYTNQVYRWRPGYWYANSPDWMWIPDRYTWTPRGYVFCNGYWDYAEWSRRGCLFAPVYFNRPIYRTAGYFYTPRVLINFNFLGDNFFCRPGYRSYYFGDYYGSSFVGLGFRHWFVSAQFGRGWDPYYNHYRYSYGRNNPRWHEHWRDRYDHYSRNERDRPPHRWKDAKDWERRDGDHRRDWDRNRHIATSVDDAVRNRDRSQYRLTRLDNDERSKYVKNSRELQNFAEKRGEIEGRGNRGRGNDTVANGDRNQTRGTMRLPDSEQFRRSATRDGGQRDIDRTVRNQAGRENLQRSQLGNNARNDQDRKDRSRDGQTRDERSRGNTTAGFSQPGETRSRISRGDLDQIQRNGSPQGNRSNDSLTRGTEGVRRPETGLRSNSSGAIRRETGRATLDSPRTTQTPRILGDPRNTISPSPRGELDGRQRIERGSTQSNLQGGRSMGQSPSEIRRGDGDVQTRFDRRAIAPPSQGGRTLGQPPSEIRRGESRGTNALRFGSPNSSSQPNFGSSNIGSQPNFGSRDGRQSQTRNFTPPSGGVSREQFGRSPSNSNFQSSPRNTPRIQSQPRSSGETRSFRSSGGENRSFRSSGGSDNRSFRSNSGGASRSFRSGGDGDRGRSSGARGGGGGGRGSGGGKGKGRD